MTEQDHHFLRTDRSEHWRMIAGHVAAHPDELAIPLANIERWLTRGRVHPAPLIEWQSRIREAQASGPGLESLVAFLAAENHDAEPLKSCSPFVGMGFPSNEPAPDP